MKYAHGLRKEIDKILERHLGPNHATLTMVVPYPGDRVEIEITHYGDDTTITFDMLNDLAMLLETKNINMRPESDSGCPTCGPDPDKTHITIRGIPQSVWDKWN